MNPERLLKHFEQIAEVPDAIPRMRCFIVDLAVRGKLAEQDPKDDPVCSVLEKVLLENQKKWRELKNAKLDKKSRKTKSGKLEKRYTEIAIPNIEGLPKLPVTWQWVCWESILAFGEGSFKRGPFGSALTKSIFVSSGYKVYEQYCPINDDCSFGRYYITPQKYKELEGFSVKAGDFLISCSGSLGRITQIPDNYEEGVINQALLRVRVESKLVSNSFFKMLFRSSYLKNQFISNTTGMAIQNVKGVKELKAIPLPLPPLVEQHRIVAKVDELMSLCDELEKTQAKRESRRDRLVAATLHGLNNDNCDQESDTSYKETARFYFNHFPRLTTRPEHIQQLRQTILNLAVRGKLVPQDPKDEPALELLKRIEAEKQHRINAGEIRKEKPLPPIEEDSVPFALPAFWEWAPIRKITSARGQKIPNKVFSYIDVSAIDKERGKIAEVQVLAPDAAPSRARKIVQKGDVIYSCVRPYLLNIAVVDEEFKPEPIVSTAFAVLNGFGLVLPRYLWIVLRSSFFVDCVEEKMRGQAYPAINDGDFAPLLIPLPPFAEQHRIVAKVDELMVLCDEMEAKITTTATSRHQLLEATLQEAIEGGV